MENFIIRPYQSEDEKDVIDMWVKCNLVFPHNNPHKDIQRKLKVNPEWFLIGTLNNKIIASCMVGYEGHRGWINYLAVLPEYQRLGYAALIMDEAERILKSVGAPKVNLQVRTSNTGVIEFYEKIGYSVENVASMGKRLEPDEPYSI